MKIIPILFSTAMVTPVLDGSKTITRRIAKDLTDCPYGKEGDVLWVRESFANCFFEDEMKDGRFGDGYLYKADPDDREIFHQVDGDIQWKPGIHMPKAACRTFLLIKSIKLERLQSISEDEAMKEGAEMLTNMHPDLKGFAKTKDPNYRVGFAKIWINIHGIDSWNENPWVWVIEFKRCDRPKKFLNTSN